MISQAPDVQAYIGEVAVERRTAVQQLRRLCRQCLSGFEECMAYGMPGYKRNGELLVSFASQKHYIALYVLQKDVLDEFRSALGATSIGKGCIRFSKPETMDFEVIGRLLHRVAESKSKPC